MGASKKDAVRTTPVVIYMFVTPDGQAYVGQHGCDHARWPDFGKGALPDGYYGGSSRWEPIFKVHKAEVTWAIMKRFPAGTAQADIDMAERVGIRCARATYGQGCVNVFEGGAPTSADINRLWADPEFGPRKQKEEKDRRSREIIAASPEIQAVIAQQEAARARREERKRLPV
jgi:hypothetical protein